MDTVAVKSSFNNRSYINYLTASKENICVYRIKTPAGHCKIGFATLAGVLEPTVFAKLLLRNLALQEKEKNGLVLDVGTGSGILAILLALLGCRQVHAIDISPESIESCKENAEANSVIHKIMLRRSDLGNFVSNVTNKYDLVIANPPTFSKDEDVMKGTSLDSSFFCNDDGHYFVDTLARNTSNILKPGGRIILAYPSYLDRNRIESILNKEGLSVKTIASRSVKLEVYSEIFKKYSYDSEKILSRLIDGCRKGTAQTLLQKSDHGYKFILYIIEASRKCL